MFTLNTDRLNAEVQYLADVYNETSGYLNSACGLCQAHELADRLEQAAERAHKHFKSASIHSLHNFARSWELDFYLGLARQLQPLDERESAAWWKLEGADHNRAVTVLNQRAKELLRAMDKTGLIQLDSEVAA